MTFPFWIVIVIGDDIGVGIVDNRVNLVAVGVGVIKCVGIVRVREGSASSSVIVGIANSSVDRVSILGGFELEQIVIVIVARDGGVRIGNAQASPGRIVGVGDGRRNPSIVPTRLRYTI